MRQMQSIAGKATRSLLLMLLVLSIALPVAAQGGYALAWWTVDGGGYTSSSGSGYSLGATTGQPDAGVFSGGGYTLVGGFWGGAAVDYKVFLPLVLKP